MALHREVVNALSRARTAHLELKQFRASRKAAQALTSALSTGGLNETARQVITDAISTAETDASGKKLRLMHSPERKVAARLRKEIAASRIKIRVFRDALGIEPEGEFALAQDEAVKAVKRHYAAIVENLPEKPIHEIPYEAIIRKAGETLAMHRDFKATEPHMLLPMHGGKPTYSKFELAHKILTERVLSHLLAERRIARNQIPLFRKALGELYGQVTSEARHAQLAAFNSLEKKIGREDTDLLVKRASELWQTHSREYERTREKLGDEMRDLRLPPHMFGNPTNHIVLTFSKNAAEMRERLEVLKTDRLAPNHGYRLEAA